VQKKKSGIRVGLDVEIRVGLEGCEDLGGLRRRTFTLRGRCLRTQRWGYTSWGPEWGPTCGQLPVLVRVEGTEPAGGGQQGRKGEITSLSDQIF
jgi:hypothetical protein